MSKRSFCGPTAEGRSSERHRKYLMYVTHTTFSSKIIHGFLAMKQEAIQR
jgi:hypothetical protein